MSSIPHDTLTNPSVMPTFKLTDQRSGRVVDQEEMDGEQGEGGVETLRGGGGMLSSRTISSSLAATRKHQICQSHQGTRLATA